MISQSNALTTRAEALPRSRLTGGVVVGCVGLILAGVAVVPEQHLVVAVLVPVEGLDLQTAPLGVSTHDARHSLVHGAGRRRGVLRQEHDLVTQVAPALHAGQLEEEDRKMSQEDRK